MNDLDEQVARVLAVASACAPLGGPEWDALLREHGVEPLSHEERKRHFDDGPRRRGGAAPIEVRLALQSIHDRALAAWRAMDVSDEERSLGRKLALLVDDGMRDYLQRVAAPAPTTASIFANARATSPTWAGAAPAGLSQMKCTTCGAPRKSDGPALVCIYCGGTLR